MRPIPKMLAAALLVGVGVVALWGWVEVLSWHQCMLTGPWWYCLRVLGK